MKASWSQILGRTFVFVVLYVLIGNARSIEVNPFFPGAIIAVYMVVPVIAGMLFGMRTGLLVGLIGTAVNAGIYQTYDPDRAVFEALAILPHGIMGMTAGWLRGKLPTPFIAPSVIVGHLLNLVAFLIAGKMEFSALSDGQLWLALAYESFLGVITIIVMITVYRLGFPEPRV